jgi:hypothetical protein
MSESEHLARAKEFLAIAESDNSKREAYKMAAEEVAAAISKGATQMVVATTIGKSREFVKTLLKWRDSGFESETPWLMDKQATSRAALSHTKATLRNAPLEQIERIVESLTPAEAAKLAQAALGKPGIADEMLKNPDQSHAVGLVSAQVHQQMEERSKARRSRDRNAGGISGVAANINFIVDVIGTLNKAKRDLATSYEEAASYILNDLETEAVEEALAEIELIIDWYRSYLQSGDQSFEKELEKLLGGDGS